MKKDFTMNENPAPEAELEPVSADELPDPRLPRRGRGKAAL